MPKFITIEDMFILLFLCLSIILDGEFVKTLLDCDETAWQQLDDGSIPPEQNLAIIASLTNTLAQSVPRSFLKEHAVDSSPLRQGKIAQLEGRIIYAKKYDETVSVYCCRVILNDGMQADIFIPSVPQAWMQDGLILNDRIAAFGIYIKSYNDRPIFAAPAIQWFPDTWLGNLGFDVGSLDQVPVSRVTEVEQNDEETNRRLFKFTESDREPFYSLLRAVSATPEGWLEEEAKKQHAETPIGITDLFNRPLETRGKPVLLRGTAKRIIPTPVVDSDVQSLFGIDHYYQIYLFTGQSQGNPIVVCVRSLPEGMPMGDTADFSEPITVAAVPYKLWIYETREGPHYAPVLVGREPVWHPKTAARRLPSKSVTSFTYTVFFTLVLLWFACRYWVRRRA